MLDQFNARNRSIILFEIHDQTQLPQKTPNSAPVLDPPLAGRLDPTPNPLNQHLLSDNTLDPVQIVNPITYRIIPHAYLF